MFVFMIYKSFRDSSKKESVQVKTKQHLVSFRLTSEQAVKDVSLKLRLVAGSIGSLRIGAGAQLYYCQKTVLFIAIKSL